MQLTSYILAIALLLGGAATSRGAQPVSFEEFHQIVGGSLPRQGTIEAVFIVRGSSAGEILVAYDAGTRAWYRMNERSVVGRFPSGVEFKGEPRFGGIQPHDHGSTPELAVVAAFPTAILLYLIDNPSAVISVERSSPDVLLVKYTIPAGPRLQNWCAEVSAQNARVLRWWLDDPTDRRERVFEYHTESPAEFPVPLDLGSPFRLASFRHYSPEESLALFEKNRIESAAVQVRLNFDAALAEAAGSKLAASGDASAPTLGIANNPLVRFRTPALITGGVLILAGLIAYLVRRRTSS